MSKRTEAGLYLGGALVLAAYRLLTDPLGFLQWVAWMVLVGGAVLLFWRLRAKRS